MKLTKISILAGIVIASNASLQAALIATDGFATDATAGTYTAGTIHGQDATPTGTTGFGDAGADPSTSTSWVNATGNVQFSSTLSLTHSGLTGTAQSGAVGMRSYLDQDRNDNRALVGTVPTVSSYFLSGLVQANSGQYKDGNQRNMGFMDTIGGAVYDISSGFFLGINAHDGQVNLAVFANNTAYDLFDVSTSNFDDTFQIVARLDVDASGNETLSAWYAADGATGLTMGLAATNVGNIWQEVGDLDTFVVQTDSAAGTATAYQPFDEMRFGTSLGDVTAIPEPSAFAVMLSMAALGCVLLRRRLA